jgi:hypothetical protein
MWNTVMRSIPVFFLWAAGLAINAHGIIPHDHHQVESVAGQEDSCPVSPEKENHKTGFPIHCHFCNDLTSEKAVLQVLFRNIQCKYFVITGLTDYLILNLYPNGIKTVEFIRLPFKSEIPVLSLFRAPPL